MTKHMTGTREQWLAARLGLLEQALERRAAFHPHRLVTVVRQSAKNFLGVGAVSRLHGHVELGALGRNVEEQAGMIDAENIGAELAQPARDLAQNPGPVGDGQTERYNAVIPLQFAHHDGSKDARIDIAAAKD